MALDVAVLMDPIEHIKIKKDSTFAMLLEAQQRGHRVRYLEPGSLAMRGGVPEARSARLRVRDDPSGWHELDPFEATALTDFDVILMRRDPPVDASYLHDTHILSRAAELGTHVVNDPTGLRDMNEKLFALHFPQCCPPTLVSARMDDLVAFVKDCGDCVLKPLDGMGGRSIFRSRADDPNLKVILETLLGSGEGPALAQKFQPEISEGDKRILLVNGEPVPYCLARIPQGTDFRGNLAAGGRGEARPLSDRDRWIAAEVGPELVRRGMWFVGLDVIGSVLTEINVTSPTCIREIDAQCGTRIASTLFDCIEARIG